MRRQIVVIRRVVDYGCQHSSVSEDEVVNNSNLASGEDEQSQRINGLFESRDEKSVAIVRQNKRKAKESESEDELHKSTKKQKHHESTVIGHLSTPWYKSSDDLKLFFSSVPNAIKSIVMDHLEVDGLIDDLLDKVIDSMKNEEQISWYLERCASCQTSVDLKDIDLTPLQTLKILKYFKNVRTLSMPYIDYTPFINETVNDSASSDDESDDSVVEQILQTISNLENLKDLDMGLRFDPANPVDNINDYVLSLILSEKELHTLNLNNVKGLTINGFRDIVDSDVKDLIVTNENCPLADDLEKFLIDCVNRNYLQSFSSTDEYLWSRRYYYSYYKSEGMWDLGPETDWDED